MPLAALANRSACLPFAVESLGAAPAVAWESRGRQRTVRERGQTPGLQIAVVGENATLVRDICFASPKSTDPTPYLPFDLRPASRAGGAGDAVGGPACCLGLQVHVRQARAYG